MSRNTNAMEWHQFNFGQRAFEPFKKDGFGVFIVGKRSKDHLFATEIDLENQNAAVFIDSPTTTFGLKAKSMFVFYGPEKTAQGLISLHTQSPT